MPQSGETRRPSLRFGKYTLVNRIAVGGMAEIFLARQAGLEGFEKTIVIKRIRPHLSKQPSFVKMFLNEAKLAAQLNHANVVQIYDLGKIGETYFIAMEYIFGRDMRRIIPKAASMNIPFPMVYALKIASSVCEGLFYAHQRTDIYGTPLNIVHRDITPENIFVSFDGTVKILDFGIAKAANQIEQTRAGEIKGKLSYMSPEQCTGKKLDQRSDIFSLGTVLYEWITGFKLFTGESEVAILKTITEGKIYAPSYFQADIPEAVEHILMRALEKDRDKRYQTAWEMQFDIDQFLSGYEFTPSNIHLSNFIKQLFSDELEVEKKLLMQAEPSEPVPIDDEHVDEFEPDPVGAHQDDSMLSEEEDALLLALNSDGGDDMDAHSQATEVLRPESSSSGLLSVQDSEQSTIAVSRRMVTIPVEQNVYETLSATAERNRISLRTLLQSVLNDYARYK
ncbi:MAG: serine/threonine protein kinase [Myxococcales bacterium]|jgi:serine/threonine-protein kinase|nr:serine/threonine protein kinase [Myxococcales bacterium]